MAERPRPEGLDPELLDRYLAGECSEADTAHVRRHLMARPDVAHALDAFLTGLDGLSARPAAPDASASWAALRRRMHESDGAERARVGAPPPPGQTGAATGPALRRDSGRRRAFVALPAVSRAPSWRRRSFGALASLAAAALLAVGYERFVAPAAALPPTPPRIYETAVRQRAELLLSDGTRVRIAPASRLRVATDFGTERRDVYLEGEAYFDVVHDARRPFTVYVGNASARDLGTAFAARGYAEDGSVQVVVKQGEVAMSGVGRLAAGDLGRLAAEGNATVKRRVNVDALLGWVDGKLAFEDAPLSLVLQDLRRWYGSDVRLADASLGALPFTGTLTGLRSEAAVNVVSATLGLRAVRREGGAVVLERIAGRTPRPAARARRGAASTAAADVQHVASPRQRPRR